MPKPMLKTPQKTENNVILSTKSTAKNNLQSKQADKMMLDRLLRKTRSKEYMKTMCGLDAGGHVHNRQKVNDIINVIKEEFPEVELSGILIGCVSKCYLGPTYEVHTLSLTNNIIEHYEKGQRLPGELEKARGAAMFGGYEFIEVYTDCCRAVDASGNVSVIN